jgi:predicted nucleic acid-binding protein
MTNAFVFDTNCLVSASILPKSLLRQAFDNAAGLGSIATSQEVFEEYTISGNSSFNVYASGSGKV